MSVQSDHHSGYGRHRQGRSSRNVRRFARRGGLGICTLLSFALLVASGWSWYNFADLKRNTHVLDIPGIGGETARGGQVKGTAQNILIVGVDSRAGLSAAERRYLKVGDDTTSLATDTIMLVHVPADGAKATLISIPRDSWVAIPGHPDAKINAAYADGYYYAGAHGAKAQQESGAGTLVAAVKRLTGVPVDHYVQVGFGGFEQIVKAIGTIPVTLCQSVDDTRAYNLAHNETGGSGFNMSAGRHHLTPQQALEFVRQRHNIPGPVSDDLGRELRQRYFLSAAFKSILSAGTLLNPITLRNLVKAVDDAFVFDNHNFDITKFAEQMINLSAGNIAGRSIPTDGSLHVDGQDALKVIPANVQRIVRQAFSKKAASKPTGTHRTGPARSSRSPGLTTPAKQTCVN
jgi:LCP family protein required for cell wall assembly